MRPHIFRAKDLTGKWRYGSLLQIPEAPQETRIVDDTRQRFKIDETTLGVSTGVFDSRWTPIFEGDIRREEIELENGDKRLYYACMWIQQWSGFFWVDMHHYMIILSGSDPHDVLLGPMDVHSELSVLKEEQHLYHVVGNVHDNPTLR